MSAQPPQDFIHKFVPKTGRDNGITLLLLHGTGGSEEDLIPLGRELSPGSALLSVRGRVVENGMPRFFRRIREGVFDIEDLKFRTNELADFLISASKKYSFEISSVVAVGYSNGANIAASTFLMRPEVLKGGVLFRAMFPQFAPEKLPDLSQKFIFLSAGKFDQIILQTRVEELEALLRRAGGKVTLNWENSDHSLTQSELQKAIEFLKEF